jgi:hypothetical protein
MLTPSWQKLSPSGLSISSVDFQVMATVSLNQIDSMDLKSQGRLAELHPPCRDVKLL